MQILGERSRTFLSRFNLRTKKLYINDADCSLISDYLRLRSATLATLATHTLPPNIELTLDDDGIINSTANKSEDDIKKAKEDISLYARRVIEDKEQLKSIITLNLYGIFFPIAKTVFAFEQEEALKAFSEAWGDDKKELVVKLDGATDTSFYFEGGKLKLKEGTTELTSEEEVTKYLFQLAKKIATESNNHSAKSVEFCIKYLGDSLNPNLKKAFFEAVLKSPDKKALEYLTKHIVSQASIYGDVEAFSFQEYYKIIPTESSSQNHGELQGVEQSKGIFERKVGDVREIASKERQESRIKLRELARRAKNAFLEARESNFDEGQTVQAIQEAIDSFAKEKEFSIKGIEAQDMLDLMNAIHEGGTEGEIKVVTNKTVDQKIEQLLSDNGQKNPLFCQQMLITCLEDGVAEQEELLGGKSIIHHRLYRDGVEGSEKEQIEKEQIEKEQDKKVIDIYRLAKIKEAQYHGLDSAKAKIAADKIRKVHIGNSARRNQSDLKEIKKAKEHYESYESIIADEVGFDFKYEEYEEYEEYEKNEEKRDFLIEDVKGDKVEVSNTGLVVHVFENGLDGLHKFSNQIDQSAGKTVGDVQFSLSKIKEVPVKIDTDGSPSKTKDLYCISTANSDGVTKTFVGDISDIEKRSKEIYETNLRYITQTDRLNILLNSLILVKAGVKSLEQQRRKNLTEEINEIKGCLKGLEPDDNDSPEQRQEKANKLNKRFEDFKKGVIGEKLIAFIERDPNEDNFYEEIVKKRAELIKNMLIDGNSTESQRTAAKEHTSKLISYEVSNRVAASTYQSKTSFDLDSQEKDGLKKQYKKGSLFPSRADSFESLMSVGMPHSPYPGISISRPRGYGGTPDSTVAITFNIVNSEFNNDVAWIALKGLDDKPYQMRVSVCDRDGDFYHYKKGERVKETHKKGDIIIDTGVVFKRNANGIHEAIKTSKMPKPERLKVEQAIRDQKIKAISVIDGNRCASSFLFEGRNIATNLHQKTTPIQEIDPGKLTKERGEIESQDVIFRHTKSRYLDQTKFAIISKEDGFNLVIPVKAGDIGSEKPEIEFSKPQLQLVEKTTDGKGKEVFTEGKKIELFKQDGSLSDDAKKAFGEMEVDALLKFASKFLSEEQMRIFGEGRNGFNSPIFSSALKEYSERAKVYVGYQEVERDGTKGGKGVFKNVGSTSLHLFSNKGEIDPSPVTKPTSFQTAKRFFVEQQVLNAVANTRHSLKKNANLPATTLETNINIKPMNGSSGAIIR